MTPTQQGCTQTHARHMLKVRTELIFCMSPGSISGTFFGANEDIHVGRPPVSGFLIFCWIDILLALTPQCPFIQLVTDFCLDRFVCALELNDF